MQLVLQIEAFYKVWEQFEKRCRMVDFGCSLSDFKFSICEKIKVLEYMRMHAYLCSIRHL